MSQVFVTSDLHFFHEGVLRFEPEARPFATVEEMNEALVDNWNRDVTKRDVVWVLGDVVFGPASNLSILDRLKGQKNLVLGNHDRHGVREYLKYFRNIEACKKYDDCLLTHVPIHPSQFYRFKANIHGHLHSKRVSLHSTNSGIEVIDPRYINVSTEQTNLFPVAWNILMEKNNLRV